LSRIRRLQIKLSRNTVAHYTCVCIQRLPVAIKPSNESGVRTARTRLWCAIHYHEAHLSRSILLKPARPPLLAIAARRPVAGAFVRPLIPRVEIRDTHFAQEARPWAMGLPACRPVGGGVVVLLSRRMAHYCTTDYPRPVVPGAAKTASNPLSPYR
jgi:hypothetical protein